MKKLKDKLKKCYNIIQKHGLSPKKLEIINSGFIRQPEIFRDDELIYKFGFTKEKIDGSEKQFKILNSLKNQFHLFNIPEIQFFHKDANYSLLVYKEIKGDLLSWDEFNNLTNKEKSIFSEHLGEAISELHSGLNSINKTINFSDKLNEDTEESFCYHLLRRIYKNKDISLNKKRFVKNLLKENTELFKEVDNYKNQIIIHSDINIQNIIFKNKKTFAIIDFDNAVYSPSFSEFRFFYLHDKNSAEISYKKYLENKQEDYNPDYLYLVGLTAALSGAVHRNDKESAFAKLENYVINENKK